VMIPNSFDYMSSYTRKKNDAQNVV